MSSTFYINTINPVHNMLFIQKHLMSDMPQIDICTYFIYYVPWESLTFFLGGVSIFI